MNYIMKYIMYLVDRGNDVESLHWMLLVGMVLLAVATLLLVLEMKESDKLALRCAWLEHELKIEKDRSKFLSEQLEGKNEW